MDEASPGWAGDAPWAEPGEEGSGMWVRRTDPGRTSLAAECEAFLRGTYVEHLVDAFRPVPTWAWTNLLAHGSEPALRAAARRPTSRAATSPGWRAARRFLAGEVLDVVRSGRCTLDLLQRAVLIPLELEIASLRATEGWQPCQLVVAVLVVLPEPSERPGS